MERPLRSLSSSDGLLRRRHDGRDDGRRREHDGDDGRRNRVDAGRGRRCRRAYCRTRTRRHQSLSPGVTPSGCLRLTDRAMIRAAALTIVLTLAGTPAATAACILWCGSPCPTSMPPSAGGATAPRTCAESLVTAPILREDSQRERATHVHAEHAEFSHAWFTADVETGRAACVLAHTAPPPGHQKPPTVLRI